MLTLSRLYLELHQTERKHVAIIVQSADHIFELCLAKVTGLFDRREPWPLEEDQGLIEVGGTIPQSGLPKWSTAICEGEYSKTSAFSKATHLAVVDSEI